MATSSKLEMTLDEIIKANKSKEASNAKGQMKKIGGFGGRRGPIVKKKFIGVQKGKQQIIRKRIGRRPQKKFVGQKRFGGNIRRKPIEGGFRNRVGGARNIPMQNKAVLSATKNLVKKLVKKALKQQTNIGAIGAVRPVTNIGGIGQVRRGKVQRVPINARRDLRPILTRINARSRVIGRSRRIITVQQQPTVLVQRVRGRGPVRFTQSMPAVQTVLRPNFVSQRRFTANTVRYVQQPPMIVQRQSRRPMRQRVVPSQNLSVREHINALRRAQSLHQLQAQFINQSQPQRRRPQQQFQFVSQQQRPRRVAVAQQRRRVPPQQQKPQQFVARPQFGAGRRQRRQQQFKTEMDPLVDPPNFLQRIPTTSAGVHLKYE